MTEIRPQSTAASMILQCLVVSALPHFIQAYAYPVFGTKRYGRSSPVHRSAYIPVPVPVTRHYSEYQVPEYDDGYMPTTQQEEYEYNPYEKYPFVPYYGYYPSRAYYHDKGDRRNTDNYGYYEEQAPNDPIDDLQEEMLQDDRGKDVYPYGQETWFEGGTPRYENNAEANAAFLQNLIIAQMYQDAAASAAVNAGNPSRYAAAFPFIYTPVVASDDYDDRNWLYGVQTSGVEDKERAKQYFKNEEDEEVKELQSLRKKNKNKNKDNKKKDGNKKNKSQKNKNKIQEPEPTNSEISNDEFLHEMQKEIRKNSRKNYSPVAEGFSMSKKQVNPSDVKYDSWNLGKVSLKNYPEPSKDELGKLVTSKPYKMNGHNFSDRKNRIEVPTTIVPTTEVPATTTERPISSGQKEVVLPRPANPVRRPYTERLSIRSQHQPSVYDTIKQLLSMEQDLRQVSFASRTFSNDEFFL